MGFSIGISGFFIAVLAPLLGAVADHSGRRKSWVFLAVDAVYCTLRVAVVCDSAK